MAAVFLLMAPAIAVADGHRAGWTVEFVEGAARMGEINGLWENMRPGDEVPKGSHIDTGVDGRVILVRGGDRIEVAPGSVFSVSHEPATAEDEEVDIMQTLGSLLFRMESRESRDFTVDTPFLAAAIKGTTFTVMVSTNDAVVTVEEGSVEVTADRTREIALAEAGMIVSVSRGGGLEMTSASKEAGGTRERNDVPESSGGGGSDSGGRSGGGIGGGGDATGGTTDTGTTDGTTDPGTTGGTTDTGTTGGATDTGTTGGATDTGGNTNNASAVGDFASGVASPVK